MTDLHDAWLAKHRARWLRPNARLYLRADAQRFLRPDAQRFLRHDWERYVQPGFDPLFVYSLLEEPCSAGESALRPQVTETNGMSSAGGHSWRPIVHSHAKL
jgi:hypothetical protein